MRCVHRAARKNSRGDRERATRPRTPRRAVHERTKPMYRIVFASGGIGIIRRQAGEDGQRPRCTARRDALGVVARGGGRDRARAQTRHPKRRQAQERRGRGVGGRGRGRGRTTLVVEPRGVESSSSIAALAYASTSLASSNAASIFARYSAKSARSSRAWPASVGVFPYASRADGGPRSARRDAASYTADASLRRRRRPARPRRGRAVASRRAKPASARRPASPARG